MNTILLVCLFGLGQITPNTGQKPKIIPLDIEGTSREALFFEPSKPNGKSKPPLVFVFHGHGGTARNASRTIPIHPEWPEAFVVYPQGLPTPGQLTDPEGKKTGWQAKAGDQSDKDLKFYDALLAHLSSKHGTGKVYATGHSNGGGFTYLLWGNRGDTIHAIAPSAAGIRGLDTFKPKPVLHLAGRNDPLVKFAYQERVMNQVKKVNGCVDTGREWAKNCIIYPSKTGNTPFVAMINDGNHQFPKEGAALIAKFFQEMEKAPNQ